MRKEPLDDGWGDFTVATLARVRRDGAGRIEELDFSAAEPAPGDAERADLFPAISPRLQAGE